MQQLIDTKKTELIDLTVTSPPYNIGKEYEKSLPLDKYIEWCGKWINQIHALTAADGTFWLNVGYVPVEDRGTAVPLPYLLWDKLRPFHFIQEVVWNYGAGVACKTRFSPRNEKFLWLVKNESDYVFDLDAVRDPNVKYPNQKKGGVLRCNPKGKNPSDVWQIPKVTSGRASKERTVHPAQFPIAVIERVIKASSGVDQIVLDPFMGSGTTAEAAIKLGRKVVGFELRGDYCSIAVKRIEAAIQEHNDAKSKSIMPLSSDMQDEEEEEEEERPIIATAVSSKRKRAE